jgi:hypothetical protein
MATIAVAADHLNMSERNFQTLLSAGIIKRAARGDYNLRTVTHAYVKHLRDVKQGIEGGGKSKLSDARARKETANASKAEFENEKDQGLWIKVDDVVAYHTAEVLLIREHLLTMPGKIADPLHMVDRIDAHRIVKDEVYESLDKLASGKAASNLVVDTIRKCGGKLSADSGLAKFLEQACDLLNQRRERGDLRENKPEGDQSDDAA